MKYDREYFQVCADYISSKLNGFEPELGLILGTGLGGLAAQIEDPVEIPYKDIPNFLVSTAPGHSGKFIFGTLMGKKMMCMSGRFHFYEGYEYQQLVAPVRVMKLMGVKRLILTNAAGAVNESYRPGEVMIIKDHIKMTGASPMCGPNADEFGPRFFDVGNMYSREMRAVARDCAARSELTVHEGVYFFFTGPQYETPAEIRAARILGGDAVGMSTVTEALTAAHCGIPVLGLSMISNMAAGILDTPLSEDDVIEIAEKAGPRFGLLIADIIRSL
ncbi:MAG: purine-nucleoside phosphorylase [Firmicutes bacterium]|nr:purine-nucleoside phosphorylase [Bacillota bacterium]